MSNEEITTILALFEQVPLGIGITTAVIFFGHFVKELLGYIRCPGELKRHIGDIIASFTLCVFASLVAASVARGILYAIARTVQ